MKNLLLVVLSVLALAGCSSESPEQVVEAYLRAGSEQNEADARARLDPACHRNEGMVRVDAVRMMGAPITIEELTVSQVESNDDTASVRYEVGGPAHSSGGTSMMFGVEVTTGEVNIEHADQSGTLQLRKVDGDWLVTCQ